MCLTIAKSVFKKVVFFCNEIQSKFRAHLPFDLCDMRKKYKPSCTSANLLKNCETRKIRSDPDFLDLFPHLIRHSPPSRSSFFD